MAARPLVIIHGWSDGSDSFRHLATVLEANFKQSPRLIDLADYISMDDNVTFDDLVAAMQTAWIREGLSEKPHAVDVIVHSTGGIIIRKWLVRFFSPSTAPIKHLVMLAPANFGSQLAHRGRAFYGRIIKGFQGRKLFNVGELLLKGLELASPYTWQLAMEDRFSADSFYGPGRILCSVFIGNVGYTGISAAANEDGSDGTVRVSCANLNCAFLDIDFNHNPLKPTYQLKTTQDLTAFGIIDNDNHSTLAAKEGGPKNPDVINLIIQGITIKDDAFLNWCQSLAARNTLLNQRYQDVRAKHGFQNTVTFVHDQFNQQVNDYFVEFYAHQKANSWFESMFYQDVIHSVHAYGDLPSYRSLYIDCTNLYKHIDKPWDDIHVSLTASPEFSKKGNIVGYRTFTEKDIGSLALPKKEINKIFVENRTLLVRILLKREQSESLFLMKKLR